MPGSGQKGAALAEERMNNSAEERKEVAIKFGKGLMGEPFTSKAGKQLVEIIKATGAKSTDLEAFESAEHLCGKCKEYAENWKPMAEKLWAEQGHTEI